MNTQIPETAPLRTVQTMIDEAKELGLRVVHRPEPKPSNVVRVKLWDEAEQRRQQMCTSPEAA